MSETDHDAYVGAPGEEKLRRYLKRTVAELDAVTARLREVQDRADEPIAVIGMSCRFPGGADSPEAFWELISGGRDAIGEVPTDRGWPPSREPLRGGMLPAAGDFDAAFFGISPREALAMDPQQRLLLEVSWEALERAGKDPVSLRGTATGVFTGLGAVDYGPRPDEADDKVQGYVGLGTAASVASGRVAYILGLHGPAITVDTACSSGLTAAHLAIESLRRDECGFALAGGATVMCSPGAFVEFSSQGGLAADGRCKPFSAAADGFGLAEGAGVLVLQRLSAAQQEGRPVLAVLRGSAVNQDGASNGLSAPSGPAQQQVIRQALERAGLRPAEIDYVEAHGTGTRLGDPIEAHALLDTYGSDRRDHPVRIGSVKSNIGHTQAAAGIAGVMKTVLALRHGELPPTLHAGELSPFIEWDRSGVSVTTRATPWPAGERVRRAGVSSFGISGTNAHVVLEEAPVPDDPAPERPGSGDAVPLLLSARDPAALRAQATQLADHLECRPGLALRDVAGTLATRRSRWEHRAVVVDDREGAIVGLRALAGGHPADRAVTGRARDGREVAMVFPGQGAQWQGMARDLLSGSPVFADAVRECEEALAPHVDASLIDVLTGVGPLERVDVVQPALFAVMVSLARLWRSFGVVPSAVVGHSQGEIAAAHVAGALSLEDAARLVAVRSRILRAIGGRGGMVWFGLTTEQAAERIERFDGRVSIASVNGDRSLVLSGEYGPLEELVAACEAEGIAARRVPVDYASHSSQVESLRERLLDELAEITPRTGEVPLYSTVTGKRIDTATMDARYWYDNLREQVCFDRATGQIADAGIDTFVEVSPHPVLTTAVEDTVTAGDRRPCVVGTVRRDGGDLAAFLTSLGELYCQGVAVDWLPALGETEVVDLPVYPFQRQRFWTPVPLGGRVPDGDAGWRHRLVWRPVAAGDAGTSRRFLLVTGDGVPDDATNAVRDALERRGATVAVCAALSRAGIGTALGAADTAGSTAVVSLLPLADGPDVEGPVLDTLALVRALGAAGIEAPLWAITRAAARVDDGDVVDPAQAMVGGLGRVVGTEQPDRWGGTIDVARLDDDTARALAAVLVDPCGEDRFAVRPGATSVARLAPDPAAPAGWTPRGTVLVTGGTGGIGAPVARWLARTGAEHLVLLNRRGEDAHGVADLRAELSDLGAGVTVAACDVSDRDGLAAVLDAERAAGRAVRSVFHAAGISRSTPVDVLSEEELADVVAAKVRGTLNLAELCADVDALVLFSSNAGVWGSPGLGAYAAANAFLDGFAHSRPAMPVTSVAWGLWAGPTMAGDEGGEHLRSQGLRAMDPARAVGELQTALERGDTSVSVVDLDIDRFLELFSVARHRPLFDELAPRADSPADAVGEAESGPDLASVLAAVPDTERRDHVLRLVHGEVASVLGHEPDIDLDRDRALRELGFDSITAVDLRNRLAVVTGVREAATVVFDHPTIARLADHYLGRVTGVEPGEPAQVRTSPDLDEPIAIIGMACRLPGGVRTPDQLWDLIVAGGDAVTEMPTDRGWDLDGLFDPDGERPGTSYSRHGAFLDCAADFDAALFGISPREALAMDPQQRQVLETTWELFENAGIDPHSLCGTDAGVFLGAAYQGYGRDADVPEDSEGYLLTGGSPAVVSGRVAYVFGLEGPAVTVDTACSSSLVALDLAGGSLRSGDCGIAVAGGVSVIAEPEVFVEFSRQGALAANGRCKPFSADADGFGFGEGVAVLLLQRLSDARRAGRRVLGVVQSSATNQDGASNGLSAPNGVAQQRVIRRAWERAGVGAADVGVVEAHGTGTRLGDPVEASALASTYGRDRGDVGPVLVGSVKANIGHTQAAAGVAGVIKVLLGMARGESGPMLCRGTPSDLVDWSGGGLELAGTVRAWPVGPDGVRRAGVSAFGVSGTNAHVILAEPAEQVAAPGTAGAGVLEAAMAVPVLLSAASAEAVAGQARTLAAAVDDSVPLPALAATLATRRAHLPHRAALLVRDHDELRERLRGLAEGIGCPGVETGAVTGGGVVFVFPGQGTQWYGMARGLLAVPAFATAVDECDAVLARITGFSVRDVLEQRPDAPSMERVDVVQPVLFAVMVSLARLWRACGVVPAAVIGHSQGEIAAAVVAGALSLDDGATVVTRRAAALRSLAGRGGMVSVALPGDRVREMIQPYDGRISVAAVNSPGAVVVSGEPDALAALMAHCDGAGVRARTLQVDYASHSAHVEEIRDTVVSDLENVTARRAEIPIYSTLLGTRVTGEECDARYWYDNLRSPVRFDEAVAAAVADGHRVVIESSPHPVLLAAVQEISDRVAAIGSLHSGDPDGHLLTQLARAHTHGVPVDWRTVLPDAPAVPLPNYAFEPTRYWLAPEADDHLDRLRYRIDWHPLPGGDPAGDADLRGCHLVLGRAPDKLARAVEKAGGRLLAVDADDRDALAAAVDEAGEPVVRVLSFAAGAATHLTRHQLLAAAGVRAPLWLVTSSGVALDHDEPLDPEQAEVWGVGRVMGLETPERWGGLIDVPPGEADTAAFAAALGADDDEDQVAVRDGARLGRRLVRAPLAANGPGWSPGGTALVTGGTGALGGHVARHLARCGVTDVVLLSSSGPDAQGADELVGELAALGADPSVVAADVTDRARLSAVLEDLRAQGRPVRIVVHAAGVSDARPLEEIDELDSVASAKVTGARLLDELCADAETFVLFSSGAGTWGSANLGAYAAANAHLDALAHRRRAAGRAATSVAWGAWAGEGMARADVDGLVRRGLRPMRPERALRALHQALDNDDTCVCVADVDWDRFAVSFTAARARPLIEKLVTPVVPVQGPAAAGPIAPADPAELLRIMRTHAAAVLGHTGPDAVGPDRPFTELGFDSLSAVGLRNRLQQATGLTLEAALVFRYPTARELAEHVAELLDAGAAPASDPAGEVLREGYRRAGESGRVRPYLELLAGLADFREHFDDPDGLARPLELVDLADGTAPVTLVCCTGTAAVSGPHEFTRLAAAMDGTVRTRVVTQPGYEPGERLPSSLAVVLAAQADAVVAAQGREPFVLAGHSAGATMAYALATELADRGHPPRGVVLLDVYPPGGDKAVRSWMDDLTATMFAREPVRMDDTRLTAMGAYDRLTGAWRPRETGLPTLLVRATEPLGSWPDDGWTSTWPFEHEAVDVPGDHFSMMQQHAGSIAGHIRAWLDAPGRGQDRRSAPEAKGRARS